MEFDGAIGVLNSRWAAIGVLNEFDPAISVHILFCAAIGLLFLIPLSAFSVL